MSRLDYHRGRKKITKHHFIRGTKQEIEGEKEVKIENSAGVPFKRIEIKGNTIFEIKKQALDYASYFSAIESYTTGGESGTYAVKLPDGWENSVLTYAIEEKTPLLGACLYLATGSNFSSASTLPLIENGVITTQSVKGYTHLIFKGINEEEIEDENGNISSVPSDITTFWQGHSLIVTSAICLEFPATIKSANEEGAGLFVRSHNLINLKDGSYSRTDSDGNILSWDIKDGIVTVNGKSNVFTIISLDYKNYGTMKVEPGTYTCTTSYYLEKGTYIPSCDWKFSYSATEKATAWTSSSRPLDVKVLDKVFHLQHCQLYISANAEIKNLKYAPALLKGEYKRLDDLPKYEPYFENSLDVPTSIEVDGREKSLPFTIYDTLVVDGARKRVIYEKRSGTYEFKGTETFLPGTFDNDNFVYKISPVRLGFKELTGNGYSTHFAPKLHAEFTKRGDVCFEYGSLGDKYISFLYDTFGYSYNDMFSARDEFKALLASQYEAGTPVKIVAEYKEAEQIDITSTDFGKALLELCMEKGKNGYLCLKSDPITTSLVCEYYSLENEDKVTLLVSYKDKNGTKIKEEKSYLVRKGAHYQILVPHIDGYTREKTVVYGTASEDTTIDLIYMEE